jgi:hypothetical protein
MCGLVCLWGSAKNHEYLTQACSKHLNMVLSVVAKQLESLWEVCTRPFHLVIKQMSDEMRDASSNDVLLGANENRPDHRVDPRFIFEAMDR